jgi:pilus assembly protein CpaE
MSAIPDPTLSNLLSVALIAPNAGRRRSLVTALAGSPFTIASEFETYPFQVDLPELTRLGCHVVVVDLDDDADQAIQVIENICSRDISMTVMACSSRNDSTLMRRSMQAGAREFLVEPLLPETVREAFDRASARRSIQGKVSGKILVFAPTKGGVGVTTIALNFALALTKESHARVVVVDLDVQLGEVALGLGMTAAFSTVDALQNPDRLDKEFLSTLLLRHSSGLAILAAPEKYDSFNAPVEGAGKLFQILRDEFAYVVVDAGTCHSYIQETLFEVADTVYLVTEMSFPSLRNAHRLIAFLSARDGSRGLAVVLNRFDSRHSDITENSATKALGRPVNWRIPNDYAGARKAQDSGVPLAMQDSPITRVLVQMAESACGKSSVTAKKEHKRFSFFGSRTLPAAEKA